MSVTLTALAADFRRHMEAENKSVRTVITYMESITILSRWLTETGAPETMGDITRAHLQDFMRGLLERHKPATASVRFRALKVFFKWAAAEGEIPVSPMDRMKPPSIPETPPDVVTDDEFTALIGACSAATFEARRDAAILWVLLDTGIRLSELLGLRLGDIDRDARVFVVTGKGKRTRVVAYGKTVAQSLDRYLRARARHTSHEETALWLGSQGVLGQTGIRLMLNRRCRQAGIRELHPHILRHTYAHRWLAGGGNEGDLMALAGWRSRQMLNRYGASAASQRAQDAHRKFSPADQMTRKS